MVLNNPSRSLHQLASLKKCKVKKKARAKQVPKILADLRCSQLEAK